MKLYFFLIFISCQTYASFSAKPIKPEIRAKNAKEARDARLMMNAKIAKDTKKESTNFKTLHEEATTLKSYEDDGWITMGVDYYDQNKTAAIHFKKGLQKQQVVISDSHFNALLALLQIPSIQFHGFGRMSESSSSQGIVFSMNKEVAKSIKFYEEYLDTKQLSDPKEKDCTVLFIMPDKDIDSLKTVVHALNK